MLAISSRVFILPVFNREYRLSLLILSSPANHSIVRPLFFNISWTLNTNTNIRNNNLQQRYEKNNRDLLHFICVCYKKVLHLNHSNNLKPHIMEIIITFGIVVISVLLAVAFNLTKGSRYSLNR